jgi:hypothetical protein
MTGETATLIVLVLEKLYQEAVEKDLWLSEVPDHVRCTLN